ncbi:hypothetical protein LXL04_032947 [Taraxacum kok-saghyz]
MNGGDVVLPGVSRDTPDFRKKIQYFFRVGAPTIFQRVHLNLTRSIPPFFNRSSAIPKSGVEEFRFFKTEQKGEHNPIISREGTNPNMRTQSGSSNRNTFSPSIPKSGRQKVDWNSNKLSSNRYFAHRFSLFAYGNLDDNKEKSSLGSKGVSNFMSIVKKPWHIACPSGKNSGFPVGGPEFEPPGRRDVSPGFTRCCGVSWEVVGSIPAIGISKAGWWQSLLVGFARVFRSDPHKKPHD